VFGTADQPATAAKQDPGELIGLAWHHVLHARTSVERGQWWQAEHWIGATRTQVIALAALRLGFPASYAKGAHLLPAEVTASLTDTLVRHLDEVELRRALKAVVAALETELQNTDSRLAAELAPVLADAVSADPT